MQDIVFYAAANETLGMIRDYANERNSPAPVLTLGVSVCLRMRLFSSTEGAAPYPIAALNGISDWQWCMDSDFDRGTACKLAADAGGISVHTETDTVNGETMNFTEFVIPISNMNTEELAAWLGNEKMKPGLTGELVGYDSSGNAAFVLQIENFSVRNRVAGLGDPTVLDQEIVTRTQAELMIQTAVSASAAAKQDKLTSANAGVGISITSSGVISTANVPQSAVSGLPETLAAKQNSITAGYRMALVSGSTVDQARYFMIEPAITAPANNTTTVVLSAGKAYEIHAVANHAKVLLTRENPPSARTFGLEGHAEIFVANTGYIQTGANVVLANALEPDAVNNCTVRFHDGLAIISVEDHVAGYIVVSATGSTAGTLPYALGSASQEYVAFDATLNGQTLDMGGAVTNGEKHVVGNGYTSTTLTGAVDCGTSKTTFANLSMNGVSVLGGTVTLGDVYIPSGSTVAVSGGGLAVEKVTGNGGVIDLGGSNVVISSGVTASAAGCMFSGGNAGRGGAFYVSSGTLSLANVLLTGNAATDGFGGALYVNNSAHVDILSGVITGNNGDYGAGIAVTTGATCELVSCTVSGNNGPRGDVIVSNAFVSATNTTVGNVQIGGGMLTFIGSNTVDSVGSRGGAGYVTLASGAVLNLTGNTNATPINPGGGVTFEPGGATIVPGGTASPAYTLGGMTVPQIGNTNVVNLNGTNVVVSSGNTAYASGCTFSGGATLQGGVFYARYNASVSMVDCVASGNSGNNGCIMYLYESATADVTGCTFTNNSSVYRGGVFYLFGAYVSASLSNCIVSGEAASGGLAYLQGGTFKLLGGNVAGGTITGSGTVVFEKTNAFEGSFQSGATCSVTISSGAIVDLTGNTKTTPINPGGGITIYGGDLNSATKIVYSSGGSVDSRTFEDLEIKGATITNLGLVYGATVYSLAGDDHEILYTEDDGATYSSAIVAGTTTYVVPGALAKVSNT